MHFSVNILHINDFSFCRLIYRILPGFDKFLQGHLISIFRQAPDKEPFQNVVYVSDNPECFFLCMIIYLMRCCITVPLDHIELSQNVIRSQFPRLELPDKIVESVPASKNDIVLIEFFLCNIFSNCPGSSYSNSELTGSIVLLHFKCLLVERFEHFINHKKVKVTFHRLQHHQTLNIHKIIIQS